MVTSKSMDTNYLTKLTNGAAELFADTAEGSELLHPPEFIETALAACMNITARMVLDRMKLAYDGVEVKVALERPSRDETVVRYQIDIEGDIAQSVKEQIIEKVYNCPVRRILSSNIRIEKADKED